MGRHPKYEIISSGHWDLSSIVGVILAGFGAFVLWTSDIQAEKIPQQGQTIESKLSVKKEESEKKALSKNISPKVKSKTKEVQVASLDLLPLQLQEITTGAQMNHSYRVVNLISEPIPGRAEEVIIVKGNKKSKKKILVRDLE